MTEKKKKIFIGISFVTISLSLAILLCVVQYRMYLKNYNERVSILVGSIVKNNPELDVSQIVISFGEKDDDADYADELQAAKEIWDKYGIDISSDSIIQENVKSFRFGIGLSVGAVLLISGAVTGFFIWDDRKKLAEIKRVAGYLEKINNRDYSFDMNKIREGEESILENEVYKTTIMLREAADKSRSDKENLKDSLSDISHQLKTPLTSMMINLDNLRDNPDMDEERRRKIVAQARRDASKMQKMIAMLLTLSRLDAEVINFTRSDTRIIDIVRAAARDVEALADLKNIELVLPEDSDVKIMCDSYWETEAIGNILKNGIEHARSRVTVSIKNYELYKEIVIENDGESISDKEQKNIFKRFYQGENAGKDSIGIGLSLAQVIVKKDEGYIMVESDAKRPDSGVRFKIRY